MLHSKLIEAKTPDGITLPGVLYQPTPRPRTIVVWIPGLGGTFTSRLQATNTLARQLAKRSLALAVFNTRGSYTVAHLKARRRGRTQRLAQGMAFERFTEAHHDITGMVLAAKALGYSKIFLAGSSTGANKVAYTCSRTRLHGVSGAIMLGPLSDIPGLHADYGERFNRVLRRAQTMVQQGRGGELLPSSLVGAALWSAARFTSLATPGTPEDTFPYYEANRKFYWATNWKIPLLVVLGSRDEYLDRPAKSVLQAFDVQCKKLRRYQSVLVPGANHQFDKHRPQLGRIIARWLGEVGG